MSKSFRSDGLLPLLQWPVNSRLEELQSERSRLMERISKLPRHSHKRIELEMRLRSVTHDQLSLGVDILQARD